jgi:hypothetical protein
MFFRQLSLGELRTSCRWQLALLEFGTDAERRVDIAGEIPVLKNVIFASKKSA